MTEAITVSKLNNYIKQIFESEELLHNIPVVGEIFAVSCTRNVIYFSLKDDEASLPCVCFYPNYIDKLVEGSKVIVTGSPSFYTRGGKLNFNVYQVEEYGLGKLYEEFLKMKAKLEAEGLFDEKHKKPIPKQINRIGVITSKEGAVLQDIKNVAWRRNPNVDIVLFNTRVQGIGAENEIATAIEKFSNYPLVDVIVVARGGGSLEDLAAYNTEIVARAVYNSPKPIVSAVGHEVDYTIIDFVSDLRAPTPSAAAEILTYDKNEKLLYLENLNSKFNKVAKDFLTEKEILINNCAFYLKNSFEKILFNKSIQIDRISNKLNQSFEYFLKQKYYDLGLIENTLKRINPYEILNKGYARIEQNNKFINSAKMLDAEEEINIIFKDGQIKAKAIKKEK